MSFFLIVVALLLVLLGGYNLRNAWLYRNDSTIVVSPDDDPEPLSVRLKWLTAYLLLLGFIAGTMVWHTDHLPKEVRESGLVKFVHEF